MSDATNPAPGQSGSSQSNSGQSGAGSCGSGQCGSGRGKILFLVLGLLLAGLAYDRFVARPAVEEAYDKITELSEKTNRSGTESLSQSEIQKVVGRPPSSTMTDGDSIVEVYSWRSGALFRTHDLFAVYLPQGDDHVFNRHAKFKYVESNELLPVSAPRIVEIGDDEHDDAEGDGGQESGGPGGGGEHGGGGSGARGQGGGRGFDPMAMFDSNDADGDGVLRDDEIPERMLERLDDIDTDGDGAVSKDELQARVEARRASSPHGRPGGEGEGRGRSRPELESDDEPEADPAAEEKSATGDETTQKDDSPAEEKPEE